MATPNVGILTTAGKALIDKVNSGQAKISFSKIVFSSMDNSQLSDMQVKALTAIAPQEVVVSSPETTLDTNSGETRIRATGTNEKLADGVYVKTYGVFAKDDTGSEILYGVTVSPNPNYFPAYDGVTPQAVTYSYKTVIQETSNITMTNSNDVYASQEDLTEALQPYAKTVDVNQQLDKKVNIADMRKPANDVAGIEEVNAKQDKIGYTPADDSKVVHKTGDEEIAGSKTFDIAPIDKTTGNPYITKSDLNNGLSTKADTSAVDQLKANLTNQVSTLQTQVNNSAVGTNLVAQSDLKGGYFNTDTGEITPVNLADFNVDNYIPTNGSTVFTFSSPDYVFKGSSNSTLTMYDSDKKYLAYQHITTATQTLSNPNTVYIRFSINFVDEGGTSGGLSDWLSAHRYKLEKGSKATDWCPNPEDKVNVADMRKPANDVAGIEEVNAKQDKIGYTPADDSKVAHLSGANNFDTVPTVNNNPLLLASSLPSDLARTSQQTNFTAGLQSGGVDVATAADLKSIEDASWHTLKLDSSNSEVYASGSMLYKIDTEKKILQVVFNGIASNKNLENELIFVNLSRLIDRITSLSFQYTLSMEGSSVILDYKTNGAQITTGTAFRLRLRNSRVMLSTPPDDGKLYVEVGYNELNEKENL